MVHLETKYIAALCLGGMIVAAAPAQAQTLAYVGITASTTNGERVDSGADPDDASAFAIEGLYTYGLGNGINLAVEGNYTTNSGDPAFNFDNELGDNAEIAFHALYTVSPDLTVGGFFSAGFGESVEDDEDTTYPFLTFGISGRYAFNDQISAYAQLAAVNQPEFGDQDSGGYNEGYAARLGAEYAFNDMTAVYFDVQYGEATDYEDPGEDGFFDRFAIGGETTIVGTPWAVTYEVARETTDVPEDGDALELTTLTLGARYYIGGTTASDVREAGILGTPDIVARASLFTDAHN